MLVLQVPLRVANGHPLTSKGLLIDSSGGPWQGSVLKIYSQFASSFGPTSVSQAPSEFRWLKDQEPKMGKTGRFAASSSGLTQIAVIADDSCRFL